MPTLAINFSGFSIYFSHQNYAINNTRGTGVLEGFCFGCILAHSPIYFPFFLAASALSSFYPYLHQQMPPLQQTLVWLCLRQYSSLDLTRISCLKNSCLSWNKKNAVNNLWQKVLSCWAVSSANIFLLVLNEPSKIHLAGHGEDQGPIFTCQVGPGPVNALIPRVLKSSSCRSEVRPNQCEKVDPNFILLTCF